MAVRVFTGRTAKEEVIYILNKNSGVEVKRGKIGG